MRTGSVCAMVLSDYMLEVSRVPADLYINASIYTQILSDFMLEVFRVPADLYISQISQTHDATHESSI